MAVTRDRGRNRVPAWHHQIKQDFTLLPECVLPRGLHENAVEPRESLRVLLNDKNRKVAASAHAYMRGSTRRFYEWLQQTDRLSRRMAHRFGSRRECRVGNLGPIGNGNGKLAIQIRDLDQTVIGNPDHDLVRLGFSLAMAARSSDLPGVITALTIEKMVEGFTSAFEPGAASVHSEIDVPNVVRHTMHTASPRSWKHLADERIEGDAVLPLGSRFWPLSEETTEVKRFFATEDAEHLVALLRSGNDERVHVKDAADWRKRRSALGRLRIAVLLRVGNGKSGRYCLVDVKEATATAAPGDPDANMPLDPAARINNKRRICRRIWASK